MLNHFLIYILSWSKSLLSAIAAPTSSPIGKNYKFIISQAKPTTIKTLQQHLWQLSVYVSINKGTVSTFAHHTYDKLEKPLQVIFTDILTVNMNFIGCVLFS